MQLTESLPGLDFSMCQCAVSSPKAKGYHSCADKGGGNWQSSKGDKCRM